jgi:hypothetical protein
MGIRSQALPWTCRLESYLQENWLRDGGNDPCRSRGVGLLRHMWRAGGSHDNDTEFLDR